MHIYIDIACMIDQISFQMQNTSVVNLCLPKNDILIFFSGYEGKLCETDVDECTLNMQNTRNENQGTNK